MSVSILIIDQSLAVHGESKAVLHPKINLEQLVVCIERNAVPFDAVFINFSGLEEVDEHGVFRTENGRQVLAALLEVLMLRKKRLHLFCSDEQDIARVVSWHQTYRPRQCNNLGYIPEITASELYQMASGLLV